MINPGNRVLTIRKRSRLGIIIKVYKLSIITIIIPAVLTALTVATAVELILTPVLTQERVGTFLISLLVLINQVPAAPTDYFAAQSSNIPLIGDKFDLTLSIESILIILNLIRQIKIDAIVGKPLDCPPNLRSLNVLIKFIKPE